MNRPEAKRKRFPSRALLAAASLLLLAAPHVSTVAVQDGAAAPQQASTPPSAQEVASRQRRTLHVTVADKRGRFAGGLERGAFAVYDRGKPLPIVSLEAPDAPVSVGIVIDASGSMGQTLKGKGSKGVSRLRAALSTFLEKGRAENEYFVIGFNQSPQLILDRTRDQAAVLRALDALSARTPRGQSALYDACYLALDKVSYGAHPKRVILAIADGQDNASGYKFMELRRLLLEQDVMVYAIGVVDTSSDYAVVDVGGRATLEELAGVSGGLAQFPTDDEQLQLAAERVAVELRWQYPVGVEFAPSTKKDGWHELEVKVAAQPDPLSKKPVKLYARARRGFYDSPAAR